MKENAIEQLGQKLLGYINATEDFLVAELPGFVSEILTYYTSVYAITVTIGTILLAFGIRFVKKAIYHNTKCQKLLDGWAEHFNLAWIYGISGGLFTLMGIIIPLANVFSLIKITVAPKLWLLEYARTLI